MLNHVSFRAVNRVLCFDCLHVLVLPRDRVRPPEPDAPRELRTRIATREDLEAMQREGGWGINRTKMNFFRQGDVCLLSYVDGELAGYTWAHTDGCPELLPGLRLSLPREYLYDYASFTHPDFRGRGLQSFRHRALLRHPRWRDKKGLLAAVVHTNYSSRRGQEKSGYRRVGTIWLLGAKPRFFARISPRLRAMGIRRISSAAPAASRPASRTA